MSTTQASLDGWALIGSTPGGGVAKLERLDNWLSTSQRRARANRSQQDGAWPSTGHFESLPIAAKGQIVYADAVTAARERREMLTLCGRSTSMLTVTDALGTLSAFVEVDVADVEPVTDRIVRYTFVVTATDPLRYGPESYTSTSLAEASGGAGLVYPLAYPLDYGVPAGTTPGAASLSNDGTATYWPRLRIDGPVTNPTVSVSETGDWVRYEGVVEAGQWLDIDCANRRVLLNGQVSHRHKVTSGGTWLAVPVGGGSVTWTADDADPSALLSIWSYQGAWL